jgi:hypothetical protein
MRKIWSEKRKAPAALVAAAALAMAVAGCSEDDAVAPPPVPRVSSVTPTTVSPGDTVTIAGSDFATPHADNKVYFHNPLRGAVPFEGSTTSLRVVVPDDAATGPVRVSVPDQPQAGVGPEVTVNRGIGEVWVFAGTGENYKLRLPFPGSNPEYLLVPHGANASAPYTQNILYDISGGETPTPSAPATGAKAAPPTLTVRERFDRHLRRDLEALSEVTDRSALAGRNRGRRVAGTARAPAQTRQFNVLNTAVGNTLNASNYTQVTAQLRYTGDFCLIYNDVDTLSSDNLTQADFDALGQFFDTQGFPSDTLYFGRESDVDNNGLVIILISGIINGLAATDPNWTGNYYIGGFFLSVDLFQAGQSGVPQGTTNEAEIFYMLAADPTGQYLYLPGLPFTRQFVVEENKQTLVHEFQHLISFSYRLSNFGLGSVQKTWLEEGMAHMAEDLVGRNDSNEGRGASYLAKPDTISLEDDAAPVEQRGGIYLFLRYLGDRFGDGIYKEILQSRCAGRPCIESITDENFYDTFADFLATLYLSGRGITADPKYNYSSIDLADFQPQQPGGMPVDARQVGGPDVSGSVLRTSGEFYLFTNPGGSEGEFTFTLNSGSGFRVVVVRTR